MSIKFETDEGAETDDDSGWPAPSKPPFLGNPSPYSQMICQLSVEHSLALN